MRQKNLKNWKNDKLYADIFRNRSLGKLPEMESGIAAAKKISKYFKNGYSVLDVGCGAGHYLKSYEYIFRNREYNYTGVDITSEYIKIAKEVFAGRKNINFLRGSIYKLPFKKNEFDIVVCNNVLLHIPEIRRAIHELIRVGKRTVIIRTLVGNRSFYIMDTSIEEDINSTDPLKVFKKAGEPKNFNYFNIYSEKYVKAVINEIDSKIKVKIEEDKDFSVKKLSRNQKDYKNRDDATRVINGQQVNGYIIMPWRFITLKIK